MTSPDPIPPAPLAIGRTRGGALRWLAGTLVLGLSGGWLLLHGQGASESAGLLRLLSVGALLAALACLVRGGVVLADRSPGLVLDDRGLVDGVSSARAGRIAWSEVEGLAVLHVRHRYMLVLQVADARKVIAATPPLRRPLAEADLRLCGSPLALPDGGLAMEFDTLVKTVHAHLAAWQERQGRPQ